MNHSTCFKFHECRKLNFVNAYIKYQIFGKTTSPQKSSGHPHKNIYTYMHIYIYIHTHHRLTPHNFQLFHLRFNFLSLKLPTTTMRMSCNGCRVLRKGCSDDCTIRPCLQWIQSPESQANATVFLAKFYGRAGLMNLINVGPEHLRPALFRSLLYEACGRIVNPIYGSVGLLWSGKWQLCQNAVEAVLKGSPIVQIASEETNSGPPLKAYDIRHISKDENSGGANELHRIRTRCRFKRSGSKGKTKGDDTITKNKTKGNQDLVSYDEVGNRSPSHESTLSHQSEPAAHVVEGESHVTPEISFVSEETAADLMIKEEVGLTATVEDENDGVELELTLGFEPMHRSRSRSPEKVVNVAGGFDKSGDGDFRMELGLDYPV
ncbi:putative transcription factor AS2-LOB family [Helianthus annuus]|uniref:Putative LOB domain-containing protein n=2 Tax=Helianthus annuus TaxID=4232 RepID=A0A251T4W1_HELAN|nr:putative transcription factor AS2-LOB family [Helianthus annuus]KAJ0490067.1 putative transcription factor AS2-LOB family [Helianthus annuus]KAJ0494155.1 putative transcription factor AS2-LOB family [Helianthus annuus]KAJ0505979.1 putative transcription factor AS2-LOB family [Helianthus annuus]KAJ0675650.1 putative transcription factor AS2-LOB family [Helianthus annuus]